VIEGSFINVHIWQGHSAVAGRGYCALRVLGAVEVLVTVGDAKSSARAGGRACFRGGNGTGDDVAGVENPSVELEIEGRPSWRAVRQTSHCLATSLLRNVHSSHAHSVAVDDDNIEFSADARAVEDEEGTERDKISSRDRAGESDFDDQDTRGSVVPNLGFFASDALVDVTRSRFTSVPLSEPWVPVKLRTLSSEESSSDEVRSITS
jgi:hypothetical protein